MELTVESREAFVVALSDASQQEGFFSRGWRVVVDGRLGGLHGELGVSRFCLKNVTLSNFCLNYFFGSNFSRRFLR